MTDVVFIEKDILLTIVDKLGILSNDIDENVEFVVDEKEFFCQELQELKTKIKEISKSFSVESYNYYLQDDQAFLAFDEKIEKVLNSKNMLKTFAIVVNDATSLLKKKYPNNVIEHKDDNVAAEKLVKNISWILSNFGKDKKMNPNVWFWSDPHFFHKNIIRYCNRPWNSGVDESGNLVVTDEDVEKMNEDLIKNFNYFVGEDDIVWCLGDFSFGSKSHISEIVSRLNGHINLVKGNHDRHSNKTYLDAGFRWVYDKPTIINGFVVLSHEPMMFLNDNCPFYNVYGHIHDSSMFQTYTKHSCCVCVERHGYMPVSWSMIQKKHEEMDV